MAQRGRPRTDSIPRFNVDTNLMNNPKFIRFRRLSGLTDLGAWTLLIKFFNYVNANHALTGYVPQEEADDLEDFCCLATIRAVLSAPNSPESSTKTPLYELLTQSGFLEPDGAVHDHDGNQPLVAEIRRKREQREKKQPPEELGTIRANLSSPNSPNIEGNIEGKENCIPSKASDARAREAVVDKLTTETSEPPTPPRPSSAKAPSPPSQNGVKITIPPEIVILANDLLDTAHIADRQDRRDIAWDVYHSVKADREDTVHRLISEIRQGEHNGCRNIVAVIRSKLRADTS